MERIDALISITGGRNTEEVEEEHIRALEQREFTFNVIIC